MGTNISWTCPAERRARERSGHGGGYSEHGGGVAARREHAGEATLSDFGGGYLKDSEGLMIWKMRKRYRKHLINFFVTRFPPLDLRWEPETQAAWFRCWEKLLRLTSKIDKPR